MVQILREQQRQYVPDTADANKAARFASTFSGLANTGLKAAQIVGNVVEKQEKSRSSAKRVGL